MGGAEGSVRAAIVVIAASIACALYVEVEPAATRLDEGLATRSSNGHL